MSDLAATQCCNNDCGCSNSNNGFSWIWILILLSCCGGCGNGIFSRGGHDNDDCCWIIILLLIFCGGCNFGCNNNCC
ncbi:MAG: chorion class high-cysteine HCB protein 13 [Clostridiales bacterium]|nr:chorion class high-cysteine HCB protein 13 [Clostridiales bacterium]MDY3746926.1 chorion class high-cysteine HCB protein 13 [Lachnospiraceae bacterium]